MSWAPLGAGFVLHPEAEYLGLCRDIIEREAEFFEITPETLWQPGPDGRPAAGPWWDVLAELTDRAGKPLVGHGLGLSPGTAGSADDGRLDAWVDGIGRDQERFGFRWYTEHLGFITDGDRQAVLPLPLPPTEEAVAAVVSRLGRLAPLFPAVGFENQVSYFTLGDPRAEAGFWNRLCAAGDLWLLLDLHNAWTQCVNSGLDAGEYLSGLDLSRVIEIHLSGGSDGEAGWLPGGRVMRLDSHDSPVPEPVWRLFAELRPRCPRLRGVVVERMTGTLSPADVPALADEVRRARRIFWEG